MRIAVLRGGPSREHEVSSWSGAEVVRALGSKAVDVVIDRDGRWSIAGGPPQDTFSALGRLASVDAVFIALHGAFGEDGTLQALLEAAALPYTGSGPAASALAMDKIRTKLVYTGAGLPTAPAVHRLRGDDVDRVVERVRAELPGPWFVKPARDGSSFGVTFATSEAELAAALEAVGEGEALVEARVVGRELTCGVLENEQGEPRALPVTELIPKSGHAFFDFDAKYTPGEADEVTPAQIDDALRERLQVLAVKAHRALGCRHLSRTDFMVRADGAVFLLETNTIPGMTKTSLVPQAAAVAGLTFEALVERLVHLARISASS
jgi:D-alanine-D-alanine ligase